MTNAAEQLRAILGELYAGQELHIIEHYPAPTRYCEHVVDDRGRIRYRHVHAEELLRLLGPDLCSTDPTG